MYVQLSFSFVSLSASKFEKSELFLGTCKISKNNELLGRYK